MLALTLPERFARRLLMDFGFGSLVTKFEEHVGPRPTRVLLWLAAVAAFVICVKAIITEGILPVASVVKGISSQSTLAFLETIGVALLVTIISGLAFVLLVRILVARIITRADNVMERAEALVEETNRKSEQLWDLVAEAEAATKDARAAYDAANEAFHAGRGSS